MSLGGRKSSARKAWCEVLLRIAGPSSALLCPREKKLAFEAVIGVLGVFILLRRPGGVAGGSEESVLTLSDLILADVGVLKGNRLSGGSLRVCKAFLLALVWGCGCGCGCGFVWGTTFGFIGGSGSDSTGITAGCVGPELRDEPLGARGVSRAFIASAIVETTGLAEMAPSNGGKLDDLAEKKGWSNSLPGDSYALGMAGTGGTSIS